MISAQDEPRDLPEIVLRKAKDLKIITEIQFSSRDEKWENVYAGDVVLYEDFGGMTYAAQVGRISMEPSGANAEKVCYRITLLHDSTETIGHRKLGVTSRKTQEKRVEAPQTLTEARGGGS